MFPGKTPTGLTLLMVRSSILQRHVAVVETPNHIPSELPGHPGNGLPHSFLSSCQFLRQASKALLRNGRALSLSTIYTVEPLVVRSYLSGSCVLSGDVLMCLTIFVPSAAHNLLVCSAQAGVALIAQSDHNARAETPAAIDQCGSCHLL